MKIVVMWEDPSEEPAAEALANVLPRIAPQLARAQIDASGAVSIISGASQKPIRVRARACPDSEEFGGFLGAARAAAEKMREFEKFVPAGIVAGGRVRQAPCGRCGVWKPEDQQCQMCSTYGTPPKAQPKPPSETRDLIFPDEED